MSVPGENIKVGQFMPDPNRHEGFNFVDQASGVGHRVEDLSTDPQNPGWQTGTLTYEGVVGVSPMVVAWERGRVQEAKPFVAVAREQHQAQPVSVVSKIAVGSLAIQLKRWPDHPPTSFP